MIHLLARLGIGVFWATAEGLLVHANPAFLELIGVELQESRELNLASLVRGGIGRRTVTFRRRDGAEVLLEFHIARVSDGGPWEGMVWPAGGTAEAT